MIFDKTTKFFLGVIAVSLCLNTIMLWLGPALVNAQSPGDRPFTFEEMKSFDPNEIKLINSLIFQELAKTIQLKLKYDIDVIEKKFFDEQQKMDTALNSIANSLEKLTVIQSRMYDLTKEKFDAR